MRMKANILATLLILTGLTIGTAAVANFAARPGAAAAGVEGSVQYNDAGSFGGSGSLRWDNNQNTLKLNNATLDLSGSAIHGTLAPDSGDAYDIGSASNPWAGLYLGSDQVIYFGSVDVLSQEVGGGDTYLNATAGKAVRILKPLILTDLPAFDPHSPGHVWRDGDTLKISSGN